MIQLKFNHYLFYKPCEQEISGVKPSIRVEDAEAPSCVPLYKGP